MSVPPAASMTVAPIGATKPPIGPTWSMTPPRMTNSPSGIKSACASPVSMVKRVALKMITASALLVRQSLWSCAAAAASFFSLAISVECSMSIVWNSRRLLTHEIPKVEWSFLMAEEHWWSLETSKECKYGPTPSI